MAKTQKRLPEFKSVEEAAKFFESHSTSDYQDEMEDIDENTFFQKPTEILTVRLTQGDLEVLKKQAQKLGIGHTVLARILLRQMLHKGEDAAAFKRIFKRVDPLEAVRNTIGTEFRKKGFTRKQLETLQEKTRSELFQKYLQDNYKDDQD